MRVCHMVLIVVHQFYWSLIFIALSHQKRLQNEKKAKCSDLSSTTIEIVSIQFHSMQIDVFEAYAKVFIATSSKVGTFIRFHSDEFAWNARTIHGNIAENSF